MAPRLRRRRTIRRIPKVRRFDVTRDEFNRVIGLLNERGQILNEHDAVIQRLRKDLDIQFKRIAELQYEIDELRRLAGKNKP